MEKTVRYGFVLALCVFVLLACLCIIRSEGITYSPNEIREPLQVERVVRLTPDLRQFAFSAARAPAGVTAISFLSIHQNIRVLADGSMVYASRGSGRGLNQSPGAHWNMVTLPRDWQNITVEVEALYPSGRERVLSVYGGDGIYLFRTLMQHSLGETIVSVADMVIGAVMIGYWIYLSRKNAKDERAPLYLGVFSLVVGIWTFLQTNLAIALYVTSDATSLIGYFSLYLWAPSFLQFVKYYYRPRITRFADLLSLFALGVGLLSSLLHTLGIAGVKETVTATHALMILSVGYFVYGIAFQIKTHGLNTRIHINLVGAAILLLSTGFDFALYFSNNLQSGLFLRGRLGLLLYLALICWETIRDTAAIREKSRMAGIYKQLAETDGMTGLYNRYAYIQWEQNVRDAENIVLVGLDLNNLKQVNDTLGHALGDRYILDAVAIIQETFSVVGRCYRIGGDEFCVAIETPIDEAELASLLETLREKQREYNAGSPPFLMAIACGYARYDPSQDPTLEGTRSRADARMYSNKKALKSLLTGADAPDAPVCPDGNTI